MNSVKLFKRYGKPMVFLLLFIFLKSTSLFSATTDTAMLAKKVHDYKMLADSNQTASEDMLMEILRELNSMERNYNLFRMKNLEKIIHTEMNAGNISFADSMSMKIINQVQKDRDSSVYSYAYILRARVHYMKVKLDSAGYYFKKANKNARKFQIPENILASQLMYGVSNVRMGDYSKGIEIFKEGIELSREFNNEQALADMSQSLAVIYKRTGNITSALQMNKSAIDALERIGSQKNYPEVLNNLASLYMELGVDSLAMKYFKKCVNVSREIKNNYTLVIGLLNLANYDLKYENYNSAFDRISEASEIVENKNIVGLEASVLDVQGKYYMAIGENEKSKKVSLESFTIATRNNDESAITSGAINLAQIYFEENQLDSAEYYSKLAFQLSRTNNLLPQIMKSSRILAKVTRLQRKYSQSFYYYNLLDSVSLVYQDSINAKNNRNFGYQYEMQRKDAENEMLQKEKELSEMALEKKQIQIKQQRIILIFIILITVVTIVMILILNRQYREKLNLNAALEEQNVKYLKVNQKLKEENNFKTRLFSIISHDLRSPVTNLYHFLKLISTNNLDENQRDRIISSLSEKTVLTINLIDNLLIWTRQQMSGDMPKQVKTDMYKLIQETVSQISFSAEMKKVSIINDVNQEVIINADPNTASLVLRNLISNALKFTDSGGNVRVYMNRDRNNYIFVVEDSGKGVDPELKDKLLKPGIFNTTEGIKGEQGTGLGLSLCQHFLEIIGGKLWFESETGKGSRFYFSLPKE